MSDITNVVVAVAAAITAVSAVITAGIAIYGLSTWRKEMSGKARFQIARKLMVEAIRVREGFSWVRFPITASEEAIGRPKAQ